MLDLRMIRDRVGAHRPRLQSAPAPGLVQASVALILHEPRGAEPELLFIERAERKGDPWSGHMALPGGRHQQEDGSLLETALRETQEEVGVTPDRVLGRVDDFAGSRGPRIPQLRVAGIVCEVTERPRLRLNHEVRSAVWVPLGWILDPASRTWLRIADDPRPRPAFRYDRYVVWGLTHRIVSDFFAILGRSLPVPPEPSEIPGLGADGEAAGAVLQGVGQAPRLEAAAVVPCGGSCASDE